MVTNDNIYFHGNKSIIEQYKIAFLCSISCPAHIVLKSYDWAIAQREKGNCILSGFHSKIVRDVFHFLLKGKQPVILVLARGLKKKYDKEIEQALNDNRLLIVSPFEKSVKRITNKTSIKRNEMMAEIADEIFVAYASPNGKLNKLIEKCISGGKNVFTFDVYENNCLLERDALGY